jgi:hypothetical protein
VNRLGLKRDLYHIPRHKLLLNHKTKRAFWFATSTYKLLAPVQRINVCSEKKPFLFSHLDQWCEKEGYEYFRRPATEADLLEGTESVPSRTFEEVMDRLHAQSQLAKDEEEGAETIERQYGTAELIFKIRSTTDWFDVGLVDSKHVTITDWKSDTTITPPRPTDDPNLSHIGVDHRFVSELELSVTAIFEVYQGDNVTVFLRKGNLGNLKVEVFDKNGNFLEGCDYKRNREQEDNYKEFGFAFTVKAKL